MIYRCQQTRFEGDPLVFTTRWIIVIDAYKINMTYAIKWNKTREHVKLDNVCEYLHLFQIIQINYIATLITFSIYSSG